MTKPSGSAGIEKIQTPAAAETGLPGLRRLAADALWGITPKPR